jgi:putative Holliday junction resolvase
LRILGIDYGDRNVGLALSDALGVSAQPLMTYRLTDREAEDRAFFEFLIRKHEIDRIVLGFPLRMDGSPGTRVEKTRVFAAWLTSFSGVPVEYWDERLTTQQALGLIHEQKVKQKSKKAVLNQIAAALILQGYLDRRSSHADVPQDR